MSTVKRLTKRIADESAPKEKRYDLFEEQTPGLCLRVYPTGRKSWALFYRTESGQQRKPSLGTFPAISVEHARELAKDMLIKVRSGEDPSQSRKDARNAPTVSDLAERYLKEHARPHKKPRSVDMDERNLRNHVLPRFSSRLVSSITYEDVTGLHHAMHETPGAANRVVALLSKMFNLAERWGLRPLNSNPCRHIQKYRERRIHRPLSELEIARLSKVLQEAETGNPPEAFEDPRAISAIRVLLFTGMRRGEVLNLRWDEVDLERQRLYLDDSKSGSKTIWLNSAAQAVLEAQDHMVGNDHVFPSPRLPGRPLHDIKGVWSRLRARAGLGDVRIHDLRHGFAAMAAGGGLSLHQIGQLLGHKSAQTTKRYSDLLDDSGRNAAEVVGKIIMRATRTSASLSVDFGDDEGQK